MELAALIGSILSAASKVISKVVDLASEGKAAQATRVARRFVATTQAELDDDRREAEDILEDKFGDSQPPPSG